MNKYTITHAITSFIALTSAICLHYNILNNKDAISVLFGISFYNMYNIFIKINKIWDFLDH